MTTRTRELREALVRADDAVRVKTDFLARISHDLRTPLTSIIGFADLIRADGREDAERDASSAAAPRICSAWSTT